VTPCPVTSPSHASFAMAPFPSSRHQLWSSSVVVLALGVPRQGTLPAAAQPDVVVSDLKLNGEPVASSVTVSSDESGWTSSGKCLFRLGYNLRNAGAAPTGASFEIGVSIAGPAPGSSTQAGLALHAGEVRSGQALVWLAPGVQTLMVFADRGDQIEESSESNNQRLLRVTLIGKCTEGVPGVRIDPRISRHGSRG
jgi:hypothetical protein